jgi:CelD/BcsL family acetyltransferase involved in cellulose biosynthesis
MKIFQDYCGTEVKMIDFGEGDADYKQRFGSDHFTEKTIYVFSRSARGLWLNGLHSVMVVGTKFAVNLLNRLRVTQRLKTLWRRRLASKTGQPGAPPAEE